MPPFRIWIMTFLPTFFSIGCLSAYSMIKQPISHQYQISKQFFGQLDAICYFGRTIISIFFMIFPLKNIKTIFTISTILEFFFYELMILPKIVGHHELIMIISNVGIGFCRSSLVFTSILFNQYFFEMQDQIYISIWSGLVLGGNLFSILFMEFFLKTIKVDWSVALSLFSLLFLLTAFIQQIGVQELQSNPDGESQEILHKIGNMITDVKNLLKSTSNFLFVIDFAFQEVFYALITLWFPYYFSEIGFTSESYIISLIYPAALVIGVIVFQTLLNFCKSYNRILGIVFLLIQLILIFILPQFSSDHEDFPKLIVMLTISGLLWSSPFSRIIMDEPARRSAGDNHLLYIISSTTRVFRNIFIIVFMLLTGFLIEKSTSLNTLDMKYFMDILIIVCFVFTICNIGWNLIDILNNRRSQNIQEYQRN